MDMTLLVLLAVVVVWQGYGPVEAQQDDLPEPSLANCSEYTSDGEKQSCAKGQRFDSITLQCVSAEKAVCADNDTSRPVLIRKCCDVGEHMNLNSGQCEQSNSSWTPPDLYSWNSENPSNLTASPETSYRLHPGSIQLCEPEIINAEPEEVDNPRPLFLLTDGWLFMPDDYIKYAPQVYCVDQMVRDGQTMFGGAVCADFFPQYMTKPKDDRIPVRRCCPLSKALDKDRFNCIDDPNSTWVPPLLLEDQTYVDNLKESEQVRYTIGADGCSHAIDMNKNPFYVNRTGFLKFLYSNTSYDSDSYCVNEMKRTSRAGESFYTVLAYVCQEPELARQVSTGRGLRKCCPRGYSLMMQVSVSDAEEEQQCVLATPDNELDNLTSILDTTLCNDTLRFGVPQHHVRITDDEDTLFVNSEGVLEVAFSTDGCRVVQKFETYCIDRLAGEDRLVALYQETLHNDTLPPVFYPILLGVSTFFMVVTFLVYMLVPDPTQVSLNKKRRLSQTVLGMILLSYIGCFIITYILLIINYAASDLINSTSCTVLGVFLYFWSAAAFFWLSVMCFEIFWSTRTTRRVSGTKRFRLYSVYAWLSPLTMSMIAIIIDLTPGVSCNVIKPGFGEGSCFFAVSEKRSKLFYLYTPIGVLLSFCAVIYILTVRNLSGSMKMSPSSMSQQSRQQAKQRQFLCGKLFLIMGLTWFFEILGAVVDLHVAAYIFDIINILQGVFIFLAFVARPKVLKYIRGKLVEKFGSQRGTQTTSAGTLEKAKSAGIGRVARSQTESDDTTYSTTTCGGTLDRPTARHNTNTTNM